MNKHMCVCVYTYHIHTKDIAKLMCWIFSTWNCGDLRSLPRNPSPEHKL